MIHQITSKEQISAAQLTQLADLLQDAVNDDASVGFLAPLPVEIAQTYWNEVLSDLGAHLYLWISQVDGVIVGTVQLACAARDNAKHRAEVQKLLVHSEYRGKGIASGLMRALEQFARENGRTLLVLDTQTGSAAEAIYRHLGWHEVGQIPDYALSPTGASCATSYFYKQL